MSIQARGRAGQKSKGRSVPSKIKTYAARRLGAALSAACSRGGGCIYSAPRRPSLAGAFLPPTFCRRSSSKAREVVADLLCSCLACVQAATDEKGKPRRKGRLCTSRPGEKAGAVGEACLNSSHTSRSPPYGCLPCPPLAPRIFPKRQVAAHNSFSAIFISKTMCLSSLH